MWQRRSTNSAGFSAPPASRPPPTATVSYYGWLIFKDQLVPRLILYLVIFDVMFVVFAVIILRYGWRPGRDRP